MSTTVSPPPAQYTTTAAPPAGSDGPTKSWLPEMSVSIIVLIVLASLCAVLGAIYAYIYYTRINPRSARAKRFIERGQSQDAEDPEKATHTHLLLFRKK